MLASDAPPTLDTLATLCASVLEWNSRLDELNGQIALRQVELARLEDDRPPTRSVKNKGSTESLRPRDGPAAAEEDGPEDSADGTPVQSSSPKGPKQYANPGLRPSSATPAQTVAQTGAIPHQPFTSQPSSPAPARPTKPQKRKPDSLMSGESATPKYRTRSMIIVYYDSAVQSAFEELVKFVSGSRNAMRKGKMAAKMAQMRRAAEMEVEAEGESESEGDDDDDDLPQLSSALLRARAPAATRQRGPGADVDNEGPMRAPMPRYTSARMGGLQTDGLRSMLSSSVIRKSADGGQDIFEKIDKAFEWCQGHCEFAAHKFLREGDCSTEIDKIKSKLSEVREMATQEVEKLKAEQASDAAKRQAQPHGPEAGKARERKPLQARKSAFEQLKGPKVDATALEGMEVDEDEGFEDDTEIVFARSRDMTARNASGRLGT